MCVSYDASFLNVICANNILLLFSALTGKALSAAVGEHKLGDILRCQTEIASSWNCKIVGMNCTLQFIAVRTGLESLIFGALYYGTVFMTAAAVYACVITHRFFIRMIALMVAIRKFLTVFNPAVFAV